MLPRGAPGLIGAACVAALLVVPAPAREGPRQPPAWQTIILPDDRDRLRGWREAWLDGLAQARAEGFGEAIAREGALLDPDAALGDPPAPAGDYRCRMLKLGRQGTAGPAFAASAAVPCRIADGRFAMLAGPQRPGGRLWAFDGVRQLFLGALALGDERAELPYGRDRERDIVGVIERIGDARWRLVLPRPPWEARIEVIELLAARE